MVREGLISLVHSQSFGTQRGRQDSTSLLLEGTGRMHPTPGGSLQQAQKGSPQLGVRGWRPGGAEGGSWLPEASQSSKIDGLTADKRQPGGHSCFSKYLKWAQTSYGPGMGGDLQGWGE